MARHAIETATPRSLKLTTTFSAVSRRGRWVKSSSLSVGVLPNDQRETRIGLRTRRGLKGAVKRNRLKRQVRAIISTRRVPFRPGLDVVIVIHPTAMPAATTRLAAELRTLCEKIGALSSVRS